MSNGHGGPRIPAKPAPPVSGPGKYARRTDGGPAQVLSAAPDQDYGAQKAQLDQQRIAPMAGTAPMPPAAAPASPDAGAAPQMPAYQGGAFNAPSNRPNEPVTHGVDIGPGGDSSVLSLPASGPMGPATGSMTRMLSQIAPTDGSGVVAALLARAQTLGV